MKKLSDIIEEDVLAILFPACALSAVIARQKSIRK